MFTQVLCAASLALLCCLTQAQAQQVMPDLSAVSDTHVDVTDISAPGVPGKTFIAQTLIHDRVQKLCAVIMDYTRYPQFMPNTEKTRIVSASDEATVIEMTLKLPLGKIKKYRLNMTSAVTPESCRLTWKLVPWEQLEVSETITDTSGYWLLTPDGSDGSKTLVRYNIYADPGPIPFGLGWIVDVMTRISLPRTLDALRERAAKLDNNLNDIASGINGSTHAQANLLR